jgi:hypothetical protein
MGSFKAFFRVPVAGFVAKYEFHEPGVSEQFVIAGS